MERRLARTLDQLELLEQRAARQEVALKVLGLQAQEVERLLTPPLVVPSTPEPPPPPPEHLWQVAEPMQVQPVRVSPGLPVVHRPEALTEEPMPAAETQLLDLLGSPSSQSSPSSVG